MNEMKKNMESSESPVKFWGSISMASLLGLVGLYFSVVMLSQPASAISRIALTVFGLTLISAIAGLVLIFRGRQELGLQLAFYAMLAMGVSIVLLLQGRTITASISILFISAFTIFWLLPRRSWPLYSSVAVTAILSMLFIEWLNPSWRIFIQAATVGPYAVLAFAVILATLAISRNFRNYSLRFKLIIAFALIALIPLVSLGLYANYQLRNSLYQDTQETLGLLADQTALQVDNFIQNQLTSINIEAQNPLFVDLLSSSHTSNTITSARYALQGLLNQNKKFIRSYTIVNKQGLVVMDTSNRYGQNDSQKVLFTQTLATDAPIVIGPLFNQKTGAASLYFSAPVRNPAGTVLGVIYVEYDAGVIESLVEELVPADNSKNLLFRVVDKENFIRIAHTSNAALLYKPYKNIDPAQIALLQGQGRLLPGSTADILAAEDDTVAGLQNLNQTPFFITVSKTLGTNTLNTGAPLKTVPWLAFVRQSETTVLAPLDAQTRTVVILSLVLLLLAALAALFGSQLLSTPILNLSSIAQKVAGGDLSARAVADSQDEVGVLAKSFNFMTEQLSNSFATLEQRVADRTRNLELAAEVGRTVSQVRALDVMLTDAAELIRQQFDLYYVQVYLVNASQDYLNLQAGTGDVGKQLLARSHRLPLNTASINGRAAIEKKAVIIADTATSPNFRPNPLLPFTRSEMAVPLLVSGKVVGVLDMQSEREGSLSQEVLPAFEALAGQLAIATQNANLLAETQQAREEVEAQARRVARANWKDYLDAIHKPEEMGYVYEQNKVSPLDEMKQNQPTDHAVAAPITVTGEKLGNLVVELEGESPIAQTNELINTVARQVAEHIESLRLLDNAQRYRVEAEDATRRITREGWQAYLDASSENMNYYYDLKEVKPNNNGAASAPAVTIPLKVRDEVIGKFAIQALDPQDQTAIDLANSVAERLSAHIESLRQYDQTQSALAQSERLFNATKLLTQALDLQGLVKSTVESLGISTVDRAILGTLNYSADGEIEGMTIIANWSNGGSLQPTAVGTQYGKEALQAVSLFSSPDPLFFDDMLNDSRVDEATLGIAKRLNYRSVAALPLYIGQRRDSILLLEGESPHTFTPEETRLFVALAPQIATVIENRRQFERAQQQAEREGKLNIISQKIQGATTVEAVLQIAARELGQALGAPLTIAQLSMKDNKQ